MLEVSLGLLAREGSVLLDETIPADDPLWEGLEAVWQGPVHVRLQVAHAGSGEIVARGRVRGVLERECRRCLAPLSEPFERELTIVWLDADEVEEADPADYRVFDGSRGVLELGDAVREELILAIDPYVVCDPECKGLCPRCGVNLAREGCTCSQDELDPRWDALRALKRE